MFANYQCNDKLLSNGPSIPDQLAMEPFATVIHSTALNSRHGGFGMVAVHTTTADLYSRLWVRAAAECQYVLWLNASICQYVLLLLCQFRLQGGITELAAVCQCVHEVAEADLVDGLDLRSAMSTEYMEEMERRVQLFIDKGELTHPTLRLLSVGRSRFPSR